MGAPKSAMTPSPVYWLIVPSNRWTSAVISSKQRSMMPCTSWIELLGERREPGDVGEENRHLAALALERRARLEDLVGEMLGRVRRERRPESAPRRSDLGRGGRRGRRGRDRRLRRRLAEELA